MEDILKQANETIKATAEGDMKEKAFDIFSTGFGVTGLALVCSKPDERAEVAKPIIDGMIKLLTKEGFTVKEKQVEVVMILLHLQLVFESKFIPHTKEASDAWLREHFNELLWDKCISA